MNKWKLSYYPSELIRDSPTLFLYQLNIDSPKEAATIEEHLATMCKLESNDWARQWKKKIAKNHYQLTSGNHRVYYGLYDREIVVFYICRKKGQKAEPIDLNRARLNQRDYESWRK